MTNNALALLSKGFKITIDCNRPLRGNHNHIYSLYGVCSALEKRIFLKNAFSL